MKTLFEKHPGPWYYDHNNGNGIELRDNRGRIVFQEYFEWPDEFGSGQIEDCVETSRLVAAFLVESSYLNRLAQIPTTQK